MVLVVAVATFLGWMLLGGADWREALVPAVAALRLSGVGCFLAMTALYSRGAHPAWIVGAHRLRSACMNCTTGVTKVGAPFPSPPAG